MNLSSEITQFNNPASYVVNSLLIDDTQLHSFNSPRASSATVIGKRIYSHSCITPRIIEEYPKFPVPIQIFTRIRRQKTAKIKCIEQPAPPIIKSQIEKNTPLIIKKKEHTKNKSKELSKNKSRLKSDIQENTIKALPLPLPLPLPERSASKISHIIRTSVKSELKIKKKAEIKKKEEFELETQRKMELQKKNSKIRLENFVKFKMEKFNPKTA